MSVAPPGIASFAPGASVDMSGSRGRVRAAEHRVLECGHIYCFGICWMQRCFSPELLMNMLDAALLLSRTVPLHMYLRIRLTI